MIISIAANCTQFSKWDAVISHMEISRLRQPCSKVVRLQQACDNLALTFARCTQPCDHPCDHPLQGAHNLAKVVYMLYNLA